MNQKKLIELVTQLNDLSKEEVGEVIDLVSPLAASHLDRALKVRAGEVIGVMWTADDLRESLSESIAVYDRMADLTDEQRADVLDRAIDKISYCDAPDGVFDIFYTLFDWQVDEAEREVRAEAGQ